MNKKILPLLLLLLAACMLFSACSGDGNKGTATTQAPAGNKNPGSNPGSDPGNTPTDYVLPLKDLSMEDGSPREITFLVPNGSMNQMDTDGTNEDDINSAIIERNSIIEEQLNCAIIYQGMDMNATSLDSALVEEMMSQTGAYDVIHLAYWWGLEPKGYFYNLLSSPIIADAIDEEFYCQGWNNATTFRGTLNTLTGYGTLDMMNNTTVTIFNKDMFANLFEFDLYEYVDGGQFTLAAMETMAAAANWDYNGDGMDAEDRYGIVYHLWAGRAMLFSMGGIVTTWNTDGEPDINFTTESNLKVMDEMKRFMDEDYTYFNRNSITEYFTAEKCLFAMGVFSGAREIRRADSGVDYGFVPYPKLNDAQPEYISTNTGMNTWAVPKTVDSFENAAYVLNAFHYYSNEEIRPVYFDSILKYQIATDEQSSKAVDQIMSSIYMDFAFIYDVNLSTGVYNSKGQTVSLTNGAFEVVRGNVAMDFVSFYTSNENALRNNIETFMDNYVTPENDY